mgnify:CR=1 FL=1
MKGPVFVQTKDGKTDSGIHRPILEGVSFSRSKAFPSSLARGQSLGLTKEQLLKLMRP